MGVKGEQGQKWAVVRWVLSIWITSHYHYQPHQLSLPCIHPHNLHTLHTLSFINPLHLPTPYTLHFPTPLPTLHSLPTSTYPHDPTYPTRSYRPPHTIEVIRRIPGSCTSPTFICPFCFTKQCNTLERTLVWISNCILNFMRSTLANSSTWWNIYIYIVQYVESIVHLQSTV